MNPELVYRMEMARVLIAQIDASMAVQECAGVDLAFHRSGKFWREKIIRGLQESVETFAPIRAEVLPNGGGEIAEFIWALEYGEVPAPKDLSCENAGNGGKPRLASADVCAASAADPEAAESNQRRPSDQEPSTPAQTISRAGSIESMRLSTRKESSVRVRARAPKFEQKKGRNLFGKRAREPIANGKSSPDATRDSVPLVPSDERSASIMAQWRC